MDQHLSRIEVSLMRQSSPGEDLQDYFCAATAHGTHVLGNKNGLDVCPLSHRGRKSCTCIRNGGGGGVGGGLF